MKQGQPLPEELMDVQRENAVEQDYIAPAQSLMLRPDGSTFQLPQLNTGAAEYFGMTDLCFRQICSALNIPEEYYDMMCAEKLELLSQNVSAMPSDRDQSYMIHSMDFGDDCDVRALLSERYRRTDKLEVASAVHPLFAGKEEIST